MGVFLEEGIGKDSLNLVVVSVDKWGMSVCDWCYDFVDDWSWVGNNWSCLVDDGVETIVVIGCVVNLIAKGTF